MKIGHIVNPVAVGESSDLFVAQPVTFRTMFAAKRFAIDDVDVDLMVVGYSEDAAIFPDRFKSLPELSRSVMDVGTFQKTAKTATHQRHSRIRRRPKRCRLFHLLECRHQPHAVLLFRHRR